MSKASLRYAALLLLVPCLGGFLFAQVPSAMLTINGIEQGSASGTITITINNQYTESVTYGQFSTSSSLASGLASRFSQDPVTSLPALCTIGICAKSDGPKIVFQLSGGAAFQPPIISVTGGTSFSVDYSTWPQAAPVSPAPMTLDCSRSLVVSGNTIACTASLPAGTKGTVTFSVDGVSWQSVTVDGNGNAAARGGLNGAALGDHIVVAQYTPASGTVSYAEQNVTVEASPGAVSTLYYYSITTQAGSSTPPTAANTGYLANGDILAYTDSVNGSWVLGYDSLDRLVSSSPGAVGLPPANYGCWSYDSFGNRTVEAWSSGNSFGNGCQPAGSSSYYHADLLYFGDSTNRITGGGSQVGSAPVVNWPTPTTSTYDSDGNFIHDLNPAVDNSYIYNAQGQICAEIVAGGMIGYLYNAEGIRVAKGPITSMSCDPAANGFLGNISQATLYVIGPAGSELTEYGNGGTTWTHTNVAGIATYDASEVHFHIYDWLGTRRMQTSYAGVMEASWQSDPFGNHLTNVTADVSMSHFTGKDRDAESGLDYFQSRYYNSNGGRFLSPDDGSGQSASDPRSLNLYSYVRNNPLNLIDPDGHKYLYDDQFSDPGYDPPVTGQVAPGATPTASCPTGLVCAVVDAVVTAAKDVWNWITQPGSPGAADTTPPDTEFLLQSAAYRGQPAQQNAPNPQQVKEGRGFIAASGYDIIFVNGHWQPSSTSSDADIASWWKDYNTAYRAALASGAGASGAMAILGGRIRTGAGSSLTQTQFRDLAKYEGMSPVKDTSRFQSGGRPVFEKGGRYFSGDTDGHSSGVWKEFNRSGQRIGTVDINFNRVGP